jgi:hypothetical protein
VVDFVGSGEDLLQGLTDFVDGGESGDLAAAGDPCKDSQHNDDSEEDKKDKKVFGHAACS